MAARFALGVEYDGNDFCGWQSQDCGCGAQDALQTALSAIADSPIKVWAAGRTDAGVHATAQTVHFNSAAVRQPLRLAARGKRAFAKRHGRVVAEKNSR